MITTLDERKIGELGTCENCKQSNKIGRLVEAVGFNQENRGNFFVCFDCFRPRIYWKKSETSMTYCSPIKGEIDTAITMIKSRFMFNGKN